MNILIAILFLIFATFTSSTLIRRQDALNGFKECQGNFPNKITSHEFTPNPIVAGQVVTVHMKGIATVPIEKGSIYQNTVFYNNEQVLQHNDDFCKEVVIPSGFTCPVKGDFNFVNTFPADTSPNDPKNSVLEFFVRILTSNPDGRNLSCIEGNVKFSYP
ncbi:hypothetical protein RhiirA5_497830 [Rhizophagus irregularis]|uniref:Phosphatidylglycerol/phosphatidylinositol transfer protein n=1 Tax=Rhizophagus irregularis TaxID=588596 RepID=A0A2I1EZV4_9GLOM|nr:hypothetical protein RhiirA5_497830 [Rhizophagus irregularis]PKC67718.1 hypothetical protein RhiirA1_534704 [Rhizophagus irregularis]PKC69067.1 hypothetical protein RhiirA1_533705 [Rhizophagus irregularis]PKY27643.1 hypothetical protein RhiirB3_529324 [Rhizophagus irregularis]CAB4488627.1 unnamed protein product [Rhizophagus irregularis]